MGSLLFLFVFSTQAQNTKGDKPAATPSVPKEKKGKLFGKKSRGGTRVGSSGQQRARNVFPQGGPFVHNPSKTPKKEKASTVRMPSAIQQSTPPSGRDKAWTKGTSSGTRIQPRSVSGKITKVYPQRGPYINNPSNGPKKERPSSVRLPSSVQTTKRPSGRDKPWTRGTVSGGSLTPRSTSAKVKKVFPQSGPYVNNSSPKGGARNTFPQKGPYVSNPSRVAKVPGSNPKNAPLSKSRRLSASQAAAQARSMGIRGAGFKTITSQFLTRGRKNVYWGKFSKKEKAITTDIAGRKLRTRNYHSPKVGLVGRDTLPFFKRSPGGVKRSSSQLGGGYRSATRTGRAWSGDISGNKIRKNTAGANGERTGDFVWPRRLSATLRGERSGKSLRKRSVQSATRTGKASAYPIPPKPPGLGGSALLNFSKTSKGLSRPKGLGGSASGKPWNNNRQSTSVRKAGVGTINASKFSGRIRGEAGGNGISRIGLNFTGYKKSRRPEKGGGSVSGKIWNNQNHPLAVKPGGPGTLQAGTFQGRTKTRGPLKGGGSVSGQVWNNNRQPISVNKAGAGTINAAQFKGRTKAAPVGSQMSQVGLNFTGYKKTRKPEKGGGSVSGAIWNNQNHPLAVKPAGRGTIRAGAFQGNVKTHRPEKGGGSVSGQIWNNRNQPIEVKTAGQGTVSAAAFKGKTKYSKPTETAGKPANFQGNLKGFVVGKRFNPVGLNYDGDYKQKKGGIDNKERSLISKLFKKDNTGMLPATHIGRDERVATHTEKGKRYFFSRYVQNPKAADESLKKDRLPNGLIINLPIVNQTKRSVNAGHYVHTMKQYWDYKHNPNTSKLAIKLREPGKSQARIGDLQVNVKMRKYNDHSLHPDAKFAHGYRDNVKDERTILMNVRLTWAKLFKKSDNQPRGLKQKPGKPRYDPNEKGLWYE